jgi:hypothetical protein
MPKASLLVAMTTLLYLKLPDSDSIPNDLMTCSRDLFYLYCISCAKEHAFY